MVSVSDIFVCLAKVYEGSAHPDGMASGFKVGLDIRMS